jgi:PleD family two-component response regulator
VGLLTSQRLRGEQDVPTILRHLDQALYKAKAGGKNSVVLAD